ncbi:MAG: endonuclease V [Planctomycetota bacterium]|nr:endonuclease V [Planctomycetota bacterium]
MKLFNKKRQIHQYLIQSASGRRKFITKISSNCPKILVSIVLSYLVRLKMKKLHNWNLSYSQAVDLQRRLARKVQFAPIREPPKLVGGIDCALSKNGRNIFAAVVVLKLPDFEVIETASSALKVTFPYIPGLLSFREAPVCIAAVGKLQSCPDVFLIDGQGIAHPRRLGLAAHLGLFFDKPTIGCAKSRLIGTFEEPPPEKGAYSLLNDKVIVKPEASYKIRDARYETIGAVVRTRTSVKPLFVSVGNKCLLKDAIRITLACTSRYRLPEPIRLAHQLVSSLKLKT